MAEDNGALLNSLIGMLGDNPEEKISKALSSLGLGEKTQTEDMRFEETPEVSNDSINTPKNAEGLETLLGLQSLLSSAQGEDDRARFLSSLKPFLSKEKQPKIDSAIRLLRIAKMAEVAGKSDLLKDFKL